MSSGGSRVESFDVVVVGAGISGISIAHYLRTVCPDLSFVILERRDTIGGTWSLFQYPGIRSDSDMFTFGFSWRPWNNVKVIAPGPDIMEYLESAVDEEGLRRRIRLNTRVVSAAWSSPDQRWTVTTEAGDTLHCNFMHLATGYYDYDSPYKPAIPGLGSFKGRVVHPQEWTDEDTKACEGKRVVVIGSGATAATLVPALAETGVEHVTMLQRSPGYYVSRPANGGPITRAVHTAAALVSSRFAHFISLWQFVLDQRLGYFLSRRYPAATRKKLMDDIRTQVPEDFDVDVHFNPSYDPWDQRVCLVPDGDFFAAIRARKAEVVTGEIKMVTANSIELASGDKIDADVIVTATGLTMQQNFPVSTIAMTVDGVSYVAPEHFMYKSFMISDVPNMSFTVGYSNASWTLKADLVSERVCSLLLYMKRNGYSSCCPRARGVEAAEGNVLGLTSGYVLRGQAGMPKVGKTWPWDVKQNYLNDLWRSWFGSFDDGFMEFTPGVASVPMARL